MRRIRLDGGRGIELNTAAADYRRAEDNSNPGGRDGMCLALNVELDGKEKAALDEIFHLRLVYRRIYKTDGSKRRRAGPFASLYGLYGETGRL